MLIKVLFMFTETTNLSLKLRRFFWKLKISLSFSVVLRSQHELPPLWRPRRHHFADGRTRWRPIKSHTRSGFAQSEKYQNNCHFNRRFALSCRPKVERRCKCDVLVYVDITTVVVWSSLWLHLAADLFGNLLQKEL